MFLISLFVDLIYIMYINIYLNHKFHCICIRYYYVSRDLHPSQLRIVRGRIDSGELATIVGDPLLQKYCDQDRMVVWYDFNEDPSSTVVGAPGSPP